MEIAAGGISCADLRLLPPELAEADLRAAAQRLFGVDGAFEALVGERDQNFRITTAEGVRYVLKVSGASEPAELVDFQTQALLHLARVAPNLGVPRIIPTVDGTPSATLSDAHGTPHIVRLLSYLPGAPIGAGPPPTLAGLREIGAFQAAVCRALRGFFHPAARHFMPWDVRTGLLGSSDFREFVRADLAALCEPVIEHLEREVLPGLEALRAQVIHHDVHSGNLLHDPGRGETVTGLIDFGDMIHGPLVLDLANSLASFAESAAEPAEMAAALVSGFHGVMALEEDEIDPLYDLTLARLILTIQLFRLRRRDVERGVARGHLNEDVPRVIAALGRLTAVKREDFVARLRSACGFAAGRARAAASDDRLIARRAAALGPSYSHFYARPLHIVRGSGVWLYDAEGRKYLDCYNNVPSVGHCHPDVVAALTRQARTLNTHTRYLHETIVEYAEALTATLPGDLSVCLLVCTGTEANDLAFRIARAVTGNDGAIVTEHAYHGNSMVVTELSTEEYPRDQRPDYLEAVAPPDLYRGPFGADHPDPGGAYAGLVDEAIAALAARGKAPAMFMGDAIFDSSGIFPAPEGYLRQVYAKVRAAGGLVVADEVQSGLCRLGDHMWGFQDSGVVPDIVTMGKPIGDGHPVAALVTTPEIAAAFARKWGYFNTFGGNPVSAAVAKAVLEVVAREDILGNVGAVGRHLGAGLRALAQRHSLIGDVRGKGLFYGVELVRDRATKEPAVEETARTVEGMRERGVLIAPTGPQRNVLKIRPPMVLSHANADLAITALDETLAELGG